jgi:hypothetical protein
MKKVILLSAFVLMAGFTFGQVLPKGTVIGTHVLDVTLQPGITMEQYIQHLSGTSIPAWNDIDSDWQLYLLKSVRGDTKKNSFGLLHVIKSEETRDKYINADGSYTELRLSQNEKLKPIMDEQNKLGTYTTQWTDWIIQ